MQNISSNCKTFINDELFKIIKRLNLNRKSRKLLMKWRCNKLSKDMTTNTLCKVVYFDEDSVTDYVQIVAGGKLEKTTELLNETVDEGKAGAEARAGIGVGGILRALIGFEASVSVDSSLETSFSTNQMAKNIVKNTVLTDFISIMESSAKEGKASEVIRKFKGYIISAPKESMSYVALISPYLSMLKSGTGIPAGDFNISIDKLDNTIKSAKGYYEFIGTKEEKEVIFRFNIKSFKNNYKATDLLKMDISIFAIKVGTSTISKLNFANEFDIDTSSAAKDNPTYSKEEKSLVDIRLKLKTEEPLEVFDVLLAGVEAND